MNICLLTSIGQRHAYVANELAKYFDLALTVREEKGFDAFYKNHPDKSLIFDHFQRLAKTESDFFGNYSWNVGEKILTVQRGNLNTFGIAQEILLSKAEYIVVFGCGIIKKPVIDVIKHIPMFNIHQGLSPYYRGSGTNFWPFVEGRLEYIGVTLHIIDPGIDTGGIIAHERPDIVFDDTLHTIGCKTVKKSAELLIKAIKLIESGVKLEPIPQWAEGLLYTRSDLDGKAILKVREMEKRGFVKEFVNKKAQGLIPPVRLVTL